MKKLFTKEQAISAIKIVALSAILVAGLNYANAAWSGPTASAPDGNAPAPINIGTTDQIKNGGLGVSALSVFGNGLFTGKAIADRFCFADGSCVSSWPEACTIVEPTPEPNAPTVSLTANPSDVDYDGQTTLTWSSTNTTSCSANWTSSTATSGTATKSNLTSSQTYSITCTGTGGSAQASATVTVGSAPPAPTVSLTADPKNITYDGQTVTLVWSSTNTTSCSASWTSKTTTNGTQSVIYKDVPGGEVEYSIICTGSNGTATGNVFLGCPYKTFYKDSDGDTVPANSKITIKRCTAPSGYIEITETKPSLITYSGADYPVKGLVINGLWDCNDNDRNVQMSVDGYLDKDLDGYAPNGSERLSCVSWYYYTTNAITKSLGDCRDDSRSHYPGAPFSSDEVIAGKSTGTLDWDFNCDGIVEKSYNSTILTAVELSNLPSIYKGYADNLNNCKEVSIPSNYLVGYKPYKEDVSKVKCGQALFAKPAAIWSGYYVENSCASEMQAYTLSKYAKQSCR